MSAPREGCRNPCQQYAISTESPVWTRVLTVMVPSPGMACAAFTTRLRNAWFNRPRIAFDFRQISKVCDYGNAAAKHAAAQL